jgi:N-glycosylase/DNA lyase
MKEVERLLEFYKNKKEEIWERLLECKKVMNEESERIFAELAFCICTPQTKATSAWNSISVLMNNGLLYRGSAEEIAPFLKNVRFGKNKAKYIVEARKKFTVDGKIQIKEFLLSFIDPLELREWLVKELLE